MPAPKSLNEALLAVQKSAPSIQKDAINPHFGNRYISLDTLMPQILPLLNENGLVLMQLPAYIGYEDAGAALTTRITHVVTGEFVESTAPLVLDKQNSQGVGSAITYMRRYMLLSMLGLVADTDDDGEAASKVEVVNRPRGSRRRNAAKEEAVAPGADDFTAGY